MGKTNLTIKSKIQFLVYQINHNQSLFIKVEV